MKNRHFKAIIFDLDGTLLNTLEDIADSANEALRQWGFPVHDVDDYRYFVGNGLQVLMQRILPEDSTPDEIQAGMKSFESEYERRWRIKTQPYPGIREMLRKLRHAELKLAILSNKPDDFTQKCVAHYFSDICFDSVSGKKAHLPAKPDPGSALQVLGHFDVTPCQSLFVGDSSVDMKTGVNAGMKTAGVDWGFRTKKELERAGAQVVVSTPEELINYVFQL